MATTLSIGVRSEPSVALTVRLYNSSGIPASELMAGRRAAESILRDTGLAVIFRHCGRPGSPGDDVETCDDRLEPSEVVVRVIDAPAFGTTLNPDAYGVAYVLQATGRGWLATVFSNRVEQAATRVGLEPGTLLGRVMAHEIGHLLLGNGYHGDAGLMRAEWPDSLLGRAGEDWHFSSVEAVRMQRLVAPATQPVAAHHPPSIAF